ncbi:MAG: hemerythrin domain-containing protein [Candidatus Omnitrophota bacterium]
MSIFKTLENEHDQVRMMFKESMKEEGKGKVFYDLDRLLDRHMEGEEKYLYPEMKVLGFEEDTLESIEEHHVAKLVLNELREMSGKEENWTPKLQVLKETVEHHLEEEEDKLFPEAAKKIVPSEERNIEEQYQELKEQMEESGK